MSEFKMTEEQFNELVGKATAKAVAENVELLVKSVTDKLGEKVGEIVDSKLGEKGLNKIDRNFFNVVDKEEISKMDRTERFSKFIKAVVAKDGAQAKALSEGTDSEGGYLVPEETRNEILRVIEEYGIIRGLSRIIPMKRDTLNVPKLTSSVTVYWPGENTAADDSDPVFGNAQLIAKTAVGICVTSMELLEDADQDIEALLVDLFAEALGVEEDKQGLIGTGAPFTGVMVDAGVTVKTMDTGDTAFEDVDVDYLRLMMAGIKTSLRKGAVWVMSSGMWAIVQLLKDTDGKLICSVANSVVTGTNGALGGGLEIAGYIWGKPVYLSDSMPEIADSAVATKFIIFGNFGKGFLFGDRKQVSIDMSGEATVAGKSTFEANQIAIRVKERIAEVVGIGSAFVVLKTAAA